MAKPKASDRDDAAFLAEIRKRFDEGIRADKDNRDRAIEDAEFEADTGDGRAGLGGIWPSAVRMQRERDGRICVTVNRSRTITRQVANELRLKPPAINVSAAEDGDVATAAVIEGLIRSIEQTSKAKRVYAKAGEDAARGGMGFWRVTTEYASSDTFDQDIKIKPILNPMSVVFDPHAQDSTCRDAAWCIVYDDMAKDAFKARFKDKIEADFYADGADHRDNWIGSETVRLAEYWCVETEDVKLILLSDGTTLYGDDKAGLERAKVQMLTVKRERTSQRKSVKQYLVSGAEVLEEKDWAGDRIPIVPVWGEEARIGSKRVRNGVISFAKDAVRLQNFARSANAETIAAQPKAPWLVTDKMVSAHRGQWQEAANGNPAVLTYTPDPQAPGVRPERITPPQPSNGWVQEALQSADDIKATTGIYDASLGQRSNETSGKAIMARQREGDVGTYAFVDNVMDAIEETGRIIIDLIPHIIDAPRQIRILGKKMEAQIVKVNQEWVRPGPDGMPQTAKIDLTVGKYDVTVGTGPSVTTQRQETAELLTNALQAAPMLAPVILPRLAQVIELPDADEFAAEVKQLLTPQPQQAPPPNPKDAASAEKMGAETIGIHFDNVAKLAQLEGTGAPMGAIEAGPNPAMGQQQAPQGPPQMPGAPDAFQGQPA